MKQVVMHKQSGNLYLRTAKLKVMRKLTPEEGLFKGLNLTLIETYGQEKTLLADFKVLGEL